MRKENSVKRALFYVLNKTKRYLNISLSLNRRNLNVPLIYPICFSARFVVMKTHFLMKTTRTMKSPLSQSFIQSHSSLRSAGVDLFRLLLKGWGLKVLSLMLVVMVGGSLMGQTPNGTLDFGTTANGTTASTTNTGFGGVRVGGAGGGFTIQNSGQSIGSDGELRGIAPTSTSVNSVGITSTEYGTAATTFTISFELHLSGGSSGTWSFFAGNGASFGTAQSAGFTSNQVFTGIRWAFGASSAITTNNRNAGNWNTTGLSGTPFAQSTAYYVTIIGNNSASSVSYGASNAYSVAAYKQDLWVNGTLVGDDLSKGELGNSTVINAFRFYGESSTSNVATIALDNIRWYNTCTLPPTHLTLVSVPSTGTVGSNLTSFTTEARSGSTSGPVANSFTGAITVAKVSGAGSISGTTAPNATAGVATYSNIQFSSADTYTINATAAAPIVNAATSSNITVSSSTPAAPTISLITPSNQQLSVAFTAGSDGGSAITYYKYSTNGGTNWQTRSSGTTASPLVISTLSTDGSTALTNGTSYNIQIKAVNGIGDGTATASSAATPATTPSAPSITSVTPGNQELSVAFTAGATGGAVISNYKYSTDGGSSFTAVSPASTTSPIIITSLTNGTTYDVQIKAVNAQGDGIATATTQGTPSAASVAPGAPTITSITPSNGELSVAFTSGATGGSAITNYKYSTDGGVTFTAVTPSATTSPITITGLINGTSYNVQIKAVNVIGDGAATANIVATPATTPSAPTINGITVGNTQLSVAFTAGATGGSSITNYKYSTDGGSTFTALSPAATTSPITITGLSNGTSYNIQLKAVNAIGDGIASASSSGTPVTTPGAPTIGTATAGNGQATVTFTAPVSNGGSVITSYSVTSSPAGGVGSLNQAGSGTITVTGLTNGTAYTFTVKANNAAGASAASVASNSVTPVLSAPVANVASSVLVNGFTANWDAVTSATGYKLDVATNSSFLSATFSNIVSWDFPNSPDDAIADGGITANNAKTITVVGATGTITYVPLTGGTSSQATLSGWDNGNNSKYWEIEFSTTGYYNTRFSSLQRSSNTGPKNFKVQFKIGAVGTWTDFTSSTSVTVANDFTTGQLTNISLPSACDNQSSVYLRWIMTSNLQVNSGNVASGGTSAIDNILVEGNAAAYVSGYEDLTVSGTSQAVTGLSEGTTYYYRLRATDGSTSSNSNVITVTTKQTPTVTPTVGTYTYTGSAQGPDAATNTGTGSTYTFSYSATGATSYGPSATRPTDAGTYTVTATVAANGNYVAASSSATAFTISKATPTISVAPTATDIILGQALSTSTLSGGTASPAGGSFALTSPSTVPVSTGSYSASVTYTPTDVANYNTATTNVNVSVVQPLSTYSNTQFTTDRNITRGTTELPIYRFQVDVTNAAATLSSLGFTTPATAANGNSNYVNTDITNFKAFLTTSTTFNNATQLGSTSPSGKTQQNAGETLINFTSLASTLNVGTTYYIWLTADVLSTAVAGRTIIVNAPTIGITGAVSGMNSATGTQTIISVATNYYLNSGGSLTTSSNYYTSPNGVGTTLSAAGLTYTSNDVILNIPVSVTNTSDFTLGNGSKIVVQNGGSLTVGASNTITGTIDVNDGGTLTVNNTSVLHTLGTLGTTSSTVIYNANGNQTVTTKPYAHLTLSGSGIKTVGAATVSGTLSLNAGILDIGSSTFVINGPLSRTNGTIDADAGTVSFGNSADMTLPTSLFNGTIYHLSKSSGSGILTVNDNLNITNLSTSINTGALVLASTKQLTVDGIIDNNGTLTIENGATLKQTGSGANANTGSGTYNVKQDITGSSTTSGTISPNGRFWYLGSPLSNGSSSALLSNSNQLWQWNEGSFGYSLVTSGNLSQGKSYVLRSGQNETINFSGSILSNGTVTVSNLTRTGTSQQFRGCHLVSNPYPSYLDWDMVDKTNVSTTMYVRTASGTNYNILETYNSSDHIGTSISGPEMTKYIAPMQGFWVKVTADNLTGSLTMNNTMRDHQTSGAGLRSSAIDFPAFLRFNIIDGQNKDQVILFMSPDATAGIDGHDSEKMSATGFAQFYSTVNAKKLVINGMKNVKAKTSVPLTLEMPTSKSYTFQAEEFNIEDGLILLEDKQEGVIQDLTINPTYSFFGNAGTNNTRFVVHFQLAGAPVLVGGPMELESLGTDELSTDNIQIVSNNQGTVIIRLDEGFKPEGSIRVFDASGRLVEQTDFNDQETTIQLNEQAGMYFVEVSAGKLMVKKKIVIE